METLELKVIEKTEGTLTTNLEELERFVAEQLECYAPDNFTGDVETAKLARADLNKSLDFLKRKRIDLIKELMAPFSEFENRVKKLEKDIAGVSAGIDAIVKADDEKQAKAKRALIDELWRVREFDLFPLDKVFNANWLNKGTKQKDIEAEMDAVISKAYGDLKIIEKIADYGVQAKAFYLETLDMGAALAKVDALKENAERVAREQAQREERERAAEVARNAAEQAAEEKLEASEGRVQDLAAAALDVDVTEAPMPPDRMSFALWFTATFEEKERVKAAINACGVPYEQLLQDVGTGGYFEKHRLSYA